jgi:hypothetical protein
MTPSRAATLAAACLLAPAPGLAQMAIPADPAQTCTADIAPWFPAGIGPAGTVTPPPSLTFTDDNGGDPSACAFYNWGAQAFLWLLSPAEDGRVLDSSAIFNVLPDEGGARQFQRSTPGTRLTVALRNEKDDVGEIGQAGGGGVLLSQDGALVHYGVHTNDLYAYFLTGQKAGAIDPTPTTYAHDADDMAALNAYMASVSPPFVSAAPVTLVMELKTSWVDAETVADSSAYITVPARVPTYARSGDNTEWTPHGHRDVTLALTGLHIAGTVQNHPEFVWATFEHISNAPDVTYYYTDTSGSIVPFSYDASGDFVFLATGADPAKANVECMKAQGGGATGTIIADTTSGGSLVCAGGIVPSDTVRARPWGSSPLGPPDIGTTVNGTDVTKPMVDQIVMNNTALLSLNASVRGQLAAGDPRANYVQTGAIWTAPATRGSNAPIPDGNAPDPSVLRGSLGLYNATMETYSFDTAPHCFSCHALFNGPDNMFGTASAPEQLSHIYYAIDPLPAP